MRVTAAWIAWWIALFFLWFVLAGEWNRVEIVAAALVATAGAFFAEGIRRLTGVELRIGVRDLATPLTVPPAVLLDFGIVIAALVRGATRREVGPGRFVVRDIEPGAGGARRAWRSYLATFSPNAYIVDVDDERGVVLFHDLVPNRKSEEPLP